jgi:alpha-tubulin suppressor-like RCC1 family protein
MPFFNAIQSNSFVGFKKKRSAGASVSNLLAWGAGDRPGIFATGHLGDGFSISRSSPVHVGSLTTWLIPSAAYYSSMCTKSDGTLWTWGKNGGYNAGQLGLGDTVDRSSPVQVGALTTWLTPCMGYGHAMCIKTDGTLWMWGRNSDGELGLGDTVARSSPVQLGNLTTWSQPASKGNYTFCIKTDNTLWVWGSNYGTLGLNDGALRSSPVQLGGAEWSKIAGNRYGAIAVKTAGTVWNWGGYPQFGPAIKDNSSPVQLSASTNWATPGAGRYVGFCTTTNGELWALGGNQTFGTLGLNVNSPSYLRTPPTQIGALTTWLTPVATFYSGQDAALCTRTDGTLWSWGRNDYGQLGLGNTSYGASSPTQIGTKTNWAIPTAGKRSFMCTTT